MQPGDLVFCHGTNIVSRAIRLGEALRFRKGSQFNHVAMLYSNKMNGDWLVIQAEGRGVTGVTSLSKLGDYTVVPLPHDVDRDDAIVFASMQIGRPYGFVTIASIVATLLLPKFINVMMPGTWICSALAAESLRAGGWLYDWPDIYQVTPAELYAALSSC